MTDLFRIVFDPVNKDAGDAIIATAIIVILAIPFLITIYHIVKIIVEKVN